MLFESRNLFFHKISKYALERDYQHGPVHEVHTASEKHSLCPLIIFWCRGQHLKSRACRSPRRTSSPNDWADTFSAPNRNFRTWWCRLIRNPCLIWVCELLLFLRRKVHSRITFYLIGIGGSRWELNFVTIWTYRVCHVYQLARSDTGQVFLVLNGTARRGALRGRPTRCFSDELTIWLLFTRDTAPFVNPQVSHHNVTSNLGLLLYDDLLRLLLLLLSARTFRIWLPRDYLGAAHEVLLLLLLL